MLWSSSAEIGISHTHGQRTWIAGQAPLEAINYDVHTLHAALTLDVRSRGHAVITDML
jgi:hypothetical protein